VPSEVSSSEGYSERYIRTEFSFFICLGAAGLTFALAGTLIELVVVAAETGTKDSGRGGVDVSEWVTGVGSASTRDPLVQVETASTREANVLEVALMSGCTEVIGHDTICSLLSGCLQDVSSIVFVVFLLVNFFVNL
jgi:hypothetical protein